MTMNRTIEIDEANFESEVLKSRQPVLVEFSTEWSLPSMMMNGAIEEIATEFYACLKVARVKLDSSPNLGLWYNIRCLPTILYFTGGEVRAGVFGSTSKEAVLSHLQPVISASCTPEGAPQTTEFEIAGPTASLNGGDPGRLDSDTARGPALLQYPGGRDPLDASFAINTRTERASR